jgi:predicted CoA-binding protein
MNEWSDPAVIEKILRTHRTWAVVGCSNDPRRPSHGVARFLRDVGYTVDIFRRSDQVLPHVQEAIEVGAKAVWMQLGVVNEEAARLADNAGLEVVMDRCPKIEFRPEYLLGAGTP